MSKISKTISNIQSNYALVPFIMAGYPSMSITEEMLYLLNDRGADVIELGIPYADALADGIVIQAASQIALERNVTIEQVVDLLYKVTPSIKTPIVIFTYFNPILSRGLERFIKDISAAGALGLVVPDLPLEESDYLIALCDLYKLELIFFISPSTSEQRMKFIISKAPGCLYLVSSYGVTGFRKSLSSHIKDLVKSLRTQTNKPIMLGFGISNLQHVESIMEMSLDINALVIGTAIIKLITEGHNLNSYKSLQLFCEDIKGILK